MEAAHLRRSEGPSEAVLPSYVQQQVTYSELLPTKVHLKSTRYLLFPHYCFVTQAQTNNIFVDKHTRATRKH